MEMSYNILVADDAAFIREAIMQICRESGHLIVGEASNGAEVVEKALRLRPQVIIMDLVMPYKNGIEAAQEILQVLPATRIIACSTVDQEIMKQKALLAGCKGFLGKPFRKAEVIEALHFGVLQENLPK